jgi:hypothetical protein
LGLDVQSTFTNGAFTGVINAAMRVLNTGFWGYNSGGTTNDALKIVSANLGATMGVQNTNTSGFSGVEYLNATGTTKVFTGFNNSNGQEFRFNNIATGGYINFMINSNTALQVANSQNILIGTTTDAGTNGGKLQVGGSVTASSALARGSYLQQYFSSSS